MESAPQPVKRHYMTHVLSVPPFQLSTARALESGFLHPSCFSKNSALVVPAETHHFLPVPSDIDFAVCLQFCALKCRRSPNAFLVACRSLVFRRVLRSSDMFWGKSNAVCGLRESEGHSSTRWVGIRRKKALSGSWLESVRLPPALKVIEEGTFTHCRNLKRVEFAEGLERIGAEAFAYSDIEDVVLLSSTRAICAYTIAKY